MLRRKDIKSVIYLYAVSWKKDLKVEKFKSIRAILRSLEKCLEGNEYLDLNVDQVCEIVTEGFVNSYEYNAKK